MKNTNVALVTSGTATLETAFLKFLKLYVIKVVGLHTLLQKT